MNRKALLASIFAICACSGAPAQDAATGAPSVAEAADMEMAATPSLPEISGDIIDAQGAVIGQLNGVEGPHGLLFEVMIQAGGLTPGWHGLHLHQVGNCDDLGSFKNSGGHLGKIENGHGLLNPVGPESGDVPNIWAGADGSAGYEAFTPYAKLADIADADGFALIIHAERDDHLSQPIGGAGGRVACAVIE